MAPAQPRGSRAPPALPSPGPAARGSGRHGAEWHGDRPARRGWSSHARSQLPQGAPGPRSAAPAANRYTCAAGGRRSATGEPQGASLSGLQPSGLPRPGAPRRGARGAAGPVPGSRRARLPAPLQSRTAPAPLHAPRARRRPAAPSGLGPTLSLPRPQARARGARGGHGARAAPERSRRAGWTSLGAGARPQQSCRSGASRALGTRAPFCAGRASSPRALRVSPSALRQGRFRPTLPRRKVW